MKIDNMHAKYTRSKIVHRVDFLKKINNKTQYIFFGITQNLDNAIMLDQFR